MNIKKIAIAAAAAAAVTAGSLGFASSANAAFNQSGPNFIAPAPVSPILNKGQCMGAVKANHNLISACQNSGYPAPQA